MNTPPLLALAALLFWGWQSNHFVLGLLAGGLLESSRFIKFRWSLTQADFNRLWNVCTVLLIAVGAFLVMNEGTVPFTDLFAAAGKRPEAMRQAGKSALVWFQWFPMIFLPFILAQVFNDPPHVGLATFSWWLRRQEARHPKTRLPREALNTSFAYVALCLLSASATTQHKDFFYAGLVMLVAWALWPLRTRRYSLAAWLAIFAVIAVAGYGGHTGLFRLQKKLEEMNVSWFSKLAAVGFNANDARTSLGSIGKLKQSGSIVLRLGTDGSAAPELLREASFANYISPRRGGLTAPLWNNSERNFGTLFGEVDGRTWKLMPRSNSPRTVSIAAYLRGGDGLIALPSGASLLENLPAVELKTNRFGATKVSGGPGLAIYQARYGPGPTIDSAPGPEDIRSIDETEPSVARTAEKLKLRPDMPPQEAMRIVASYFQSEFQYSTYLTTAHQATSNETALARFLLTTRAGHCEYFATATALLLRQAGLPTRYAVGWSVQEGSGKKYVVRERHAHAWTLVHYDGAWHDFDTTPSSWNAVEAERASWLQPVKDFFSDLWFQFSKFRWSQTEWRKYFMWAPVPLLIIVLARFFLGKQWKKVRARREDLVRARERQGSDSEFYRIEQHFASRGLERRPEENWPGWLRRVAEHEQRVAELQSALTLHQRHRFDPRGLTATERVELREDVTRWLSMRPAELASGPLTKL